MKNTPMPAGLPNLCPNEQCGAIVARSVTVCPRCGTKIPSPPSAPSPADQLAAPGPQYLEIDPGRNKRRWGVLGYVLFFLAVAGVLVGLFVKLSGSLRLAIIVVAFMVGYMALMGSWASHNLERHEPDE